MRDKRVKGEGKDVEVSRSGAGGGGERLGEMEWGRAVLELSEFREYKDKKASLDL